MAEVTKVFLREAVETEGEIWELEDLKNQKERDLRQKHDKLAAVKNLMIRERGRNEQHYKQALLVRESVQEEIRKLQATIKEIDDKLQAARIFFRQSKSVITIDLGNPAESPW